MGGLLFNQRFAGFGASRLQPGTLSPRFTQIRGGRPIALRAAVRLMCPKRPGVYGMLDARGVLAYVGKAKSLRVRLLSYFRRRGRDPKAGRIVRQARSIVWEPAGTEFAALLRELELIQRWRPRLNVQGQPHRRRRTYVCLGRMPVPCLFTTRRPPRHLIACYGPVHAGPRLREALRRLNDWYRLRDCSQAQQMQFADQGELFPIVRAAGCLRYEIRTCLGPCAAGCTRSDYFEQVRLLQRFLDGDDAGPLGALEEQMSQAANAMEFERAAALRDKRESIRWLRDQLAWLHETRHTHSFVYPLAGSANARDWYLIRRGQVRGTIPEPKDERGRREATQALQAVFFSDKPDLGESVDEVDTIVLVAGWFRRHPEELQRVLTPDDALRHLGATLGTG